jgi:hypothetical protein
VWRNVNKGAECVIFQAEAMVGDMDLEGDIFDRGEEGDLYCKFPPLCPSKKHGKAGDGERGSGHNLWQLSLRFGKVEWAQKCKALSGDTGNLLVVTLEIRRQHCYIVILGQENVLRLTHQWILLRVSPGWKA